MFWGDPHLITTDNFYYDFNAIGEFWLINTTDASFTLQGRLAQMQTSAGVGVNASVFVGFAAQQPGYAKVEVELNPTRDGTHGGFSYLLQTLSARRGAFWNGCHVTTGTVTSGTQSNSSNYPKPNIHVSQLIAAANQKANPEVTVQEMKGHLGICISDTACEGVG